MDTEKFLEEFKKQYISMPRKKQTFMEISGYPHYENVCSNILAFYFDINEEHRLGDAMIRALMQTAGIELDMEISEINVEREYGTENNKRIDLVLYNDNIVIGIENKINSGLGNDLKEYTKALRKINKDISEENIHKIVLSVRDESEKASQYGYFNVRYKDFFKNLKEIIKDKYDIDYKWYIYLREFIETIERFEKTEENYNSEIIKWAKENKEDIINLRNQINQVHNILSNKAKELGKHLNIKFNGINKKVGYFNLNGKHGFIRWCFIEKSYNEYAIDNTLELDGWKINLAFRNCTEEYKKDIINKLIENEIQISPDKYIDKKHINLIRFDIDISYEEIINKNFEIWEILNS